MHDLTALVGQYPVRAHAGYTKDGTKIPVDYYIPSNRNGVEVRHAYDDMLACWCYGVTMSNAYTIIREIYKLEIDGKATVPETMASQLVKKKFVGDLEWYDDGICFSFPESKLNSYSKILKLKTRGKSFAPLSKNAGW